MVYSELLRRLSETPWPSDIPVANVRVSGGSVQIQAKGRQDAASRARIYAAGFDSSFGGFWVHAR